MQQHPNQQRKQEKIIIMKKKTHSHTTDTQKLYAEFIFGVESAAANLSSQRATK